MSDNPNRIQTTTITQTVGRQTPDEFGTVLQKSVGKVLETGAKLAGPILGNSVVSAAVNMVAGAVNTAATENYASGISAGSSMKSSIALGASGVASGGGTAAGAAGGGDPLSGIDAQRQLMVESQSFQVAYLQLQDQMQKESREFNAISNIMKVRHDSAKAAINNIR